MKNFLRFLLFVLVLVLIGGVIFLAITGNLPPLPFNLPGTTPQNPTAIVNPPTEVANQPTENVPPTTQAATAVPNPNIPQPIIPADDCTTLANAAGIVIDAEAIRAQQPKNTLPNGRPFPGKAPEQPAASNRPLRNRLIIQFTPDSTQQQRNEYIRSVNGRSRRNIDKLDTYIVTITGDEDPEILLEMLPRSDIVLQVELDYGIGTAQTPNDPRYGEQWGLPVVGAPEIWAKLPANAPQITIAVIDSGICAAHPDLAGRLVTGYDFVDDDNNPADGAGHGCNVAGVIAAVTNNGIGMAGTAPNVRIMPLRVLDNNGLGSYSDVAAAIVYAVDNGAQILNLSLSGPQLSQTLATAVQYALSRNVTVIAAAGNYGTPQVYYPAGIPGVIAVGSIDPNLQRSSFSNFGAHVRIFAPGRDILATTMNGDYDAVTGTSFAAPMVAGLMAMSRALNVPLYTEDDIAFFYPPDNQPVCP
jgi:subtilisin family serine protease